MMGGLFRRLALVAVALSPSLSSPLAAQPDRPVLVFAPEGAVADPTVPETVDERLRAEVRDLIGARLAPVRGQRPADCDSAPECLVEAAVEQGAAFLVITKLAGGPDEYTLEARLVDDRGALVAAAERTFRGSPPALMLRGVAVQLFEPARYVGKLRLVDVPALAQVSIDRLPLRTRDLSKPVVLIVGTHEIYIETVGEPGRTRRVEVPYGDEVVASLKPGAESPDPAEDPAMKAGAPMWPVIASGAVAGVALLAAGGFLVDSTFTRAWSDAQADALQHVGEAGANPHFYAAEYLPRHVARLGNQRSASSNSMRISLTSAALAVASGAVAGALAVAYLGPGGAIVPSGE